MLNRLAEKEAYIVALENEDLTSVDLVTVKSFAQVKKKVLFFLIN